MDISFKAPIPTVQIIMTNVRLEDVRELIRVLDNDRNFPAVGELYHKLQEIRQFMTAYG